MNSPLPGWLDALKEQHPSQPHTAPSTPPHPQPRPGQIRRLLPVDLVGRPALVLVVDSDHDRQAHTVVLLSPDTGFGSDRDLLVGPEQSGLPYDVLIQCEVFGYVWTTQLDAVHGDLMAFLPTVGNLQKPEPDLPEPDLRAGPPVDQVSDPRWRFKLSELARLQGLTGECIEQLIDGERHLLPDPAALRPPTSGDRRDA